jgi:hypothetical protein
MLNSLTMSFLHLMPRIFLLCTKKSLGLRPILIGTSLKRILGTMESSAFASDFASHLAPFQYGIALPEGMQFLTMAIRNLIHDLLPSGSNLTSASKFYFSLTLLTCSTRYLKNPLNMNWNEPCLFYCHLLTCDTERKTFAGTKSWMAHGLISK